MIKEMGNPPVAQILEFSAEDVECAARDLKSSGGPSGISGVQFARLLLHFGKASLRLRSAIAKRVTRLASSDVDWVRVAAMRAGRLIAFGESKEDNSFTIRTIAIQDIPARLETKMVIAKTRADS